MPYLPKKILAEKVFSLTGLIKRNDNRIQHILNFIKTDTTNRKLVIIFNYCNGGSVPITEALVDALKLINNRSVSIVFNGYAISAAAYVLAYFAFYNIKKNIIVSATQPLCVCYHRPRLKVGNQHIFASDIIHKKSLTNAESYIIKMTSEFDRVFSAMWQTLEQLRWTIAPHMPDVYHNKGDVTLPFNKGRIN